MKNLKKIFCVVLCFALLTGTGILSGFAASGNAVTRVSCAINGDSKTQRGFCWYTAEECDSIVKIYDGEQDISSTLTFSNVKCEEWEGNFMHKVTVSGLTAGKTYTYKVGDGSTFSNLGTFTTDNGDDKFNFLTIGDVQASSLENFQKAAKVVDAAFSKCPDSEFIVTLGDYTNDSTNEEWDNYFNTFESLNLAKTVVPVAGNHDGLGVWNWFSNTFNLDESETVQNLNGVNYSYDYGNAHFAVLNTNDLLSITNAQLTWLKNDMNSTDADWKVVFMHKSPYSLGKDGKWPDALYLTEALGKVIDECDVDLVMSGHDHMYLRTKALKNNEVAEDGDGAVYVLGGTAGTKRYEVREFSVNTYMKKDFIDALTIQKGNYGNYWNGEDYNSTDPANVGGCFTNVTIDGGELTLNAYVLSDETQTLKQIDSFTLTKETGKAQPTFSGDNTTSVLDYALTIIPSFANLASYTFLNWLVKTIIYLPKIIYYVIKTDTF